MALDPSLEPVIDAAAQQFDLDPNLIHAVIGQESSGRADATSPKGAEGLMQLMPATAKEMGVTDPYDPTQNIYGGARYLAQGLQKGEALKAGGADVDPVQYALQYYHGGGDPSVWGPITHAYVAQVANRYNAAPAAAKPDQTAPAPAPPSDAGPATAGAALAPDLAPLAQLGRLGAPRGAEGGGGPMGGFADLATAGAGAGGAPPVAANAPAVAALAPDLAPLARLGAPMGGFADLATAGAAPPGLKALAALSAAGGAGGAGAPALMAPLSSNAADLASATGAAGRPVAAAPGGAPAAAAADFAGARAAAGTTAAAAAPAAEPGAAAPETAPAPAANEFSGLSDAQIFQGLQDGSLRVTPPPAAAPAGPGAAPPATTGGTGAGGAGAAAPPPGAPAALDVKQMIDDYNFYRSFPSGLPQAKAVFTVLSKMAPEGYQLNTDGSMTARPGYAAAQAEVERQKAYAEHLGTSQAPPDATWVVNPDGSLSPRPGAVTGAAAKAGAVAQAEADAKASRTMVPVTVRDAQGHQFEISVPQPEAEKLALARLGSAGGAAGAGTGGAPGGTPGPAAPPGAPGASATGAGAATTGAATPGGLTLGGKPVAPLGFDDANKGIAQLNDDANQAQAQIATLQQLRNLALTAKPGIGWGADAKAEIGRILNAGGVSDDKIQSLLGLTPGTADAIEKNSLMLTTTWAKTLGSREAAQVIKMIADAVPNLETNPKAYDLMTNTMAQSAQRTQDRRDFIGAATGQGGGGIAAYNQAVADFDRTHPAKAYATAAQLMTDGFQGRAFKDSNPDEAQAALKLIPAGRQMAPIPVAEAGGHFVPGAWYQSPQGRAQRTPDGKWYLPPAGQ